MIRTIKAGLHKPLIDDVQVFLVAIPPRVLEARIVSIYLEGLSELTTKVIGIESVLMDRSYFMQDPISAVTLEKLSREALKSFIEPVRIHRDHITDVYVSVQGPCDSLFMTFDFAVYNESDLPQ